MKPGDILVDLQAGNVLFDDGLTQILRPLMLWNFTVSNPGATDNIGILIADHDFEIVRVRSVVRSTVSVTWNMQHGTSRGTTGQQVFDVDEVTNTSVQTVQDVEDFEFPHVSAGEALWYVASAISGQPDDLLVSMVVRLE